jgi:plastocyanin
VNRSALLALGPVTALLAASPAGAAQVAVGVDDRNSAAPQWSPAGDVTIAPGDSVVWNLSGAQPHNVVAATDPGTTPWTGLNAGPPDTQGNFTFNAPGRYRFVCQFHSGQTSGVWTGMVGTIVVGNPPPPPPPPLSEQPFPNDGTVAPAALETGGLDTTRPALRRVALDRSGRRVTLRFRVSERSEVTVRLARAGKRVRTKHVAAAGRGSVTLRGLRPGRYRIELRARDLAGNASAARVAHVRVG